MEFNKITEQSSLYQDIDQKSVQDILTEMNREDQKVALAVQACIPALSAFVEELWPKMADGGRLFYIGAGTSGRLGVVDASECPPTFGVPHGMVQGIMAGGDRAIRKAVEFAEDDREQAWKDLQGHHITALDTLVGIAASGTTPYVIGGLQRAREEGIGTACITCNPGAPMTKHADYPLVAQVGPEYITGSTRLKSGTAQKLLLNMISTSVMVKLGRVKGNRMVDMQLSNDKLVDRGSKMVQDALGISYEESKQVLLTQGSVREAIDFYKKSQRNK